MDQDPPVTKLNSPPDDLSQYDLDDYDKDADSSALGPFTNLKGLTYYRNNDEDPYITLKEVGSLGYRY
jgi:periodic tryptophan protein 1